MATYDFRILLETKKGKQFSYISQSFFNSAVDTNYAVSSSDVWHRITGSLSCSFQNNFLFSSSADQFHDTNIFKNNPYLSSSLISGYESGSIRFHTNGVTGSDGDKLRRFKFFGEKVCTSLGIPHNLWQFTDEFRLVSGSERHYFRGDVVADSLHVVNNMAISNLGTMDSDLPFKVDKQSDRFIKWQLSSASVAPSNDLLIGYNDTLDQYWISASDSATFNIGGIDRFNVKTLDMDEVLASEILLGSAGAIYWDKNTDTYTRIYEQSDHLNIEANRDLVLNSKNDDIVLKKDGDIVLHMHGATKRIGIGPDQNFYTKPPMHELQVKGAISASGYGYFGQVVNLTGTDPRLKLHATAGDHPGYELYDGAARKWVIYNDPDDSHNLNIKDDGDDRVSITQTGRVGIGKTGPTKTLEVVGDISASGDLYLQEDKAIIFDHPSGVLASQRIVNDGTSIILSGSGNPVSFDLKNSRIGIFGSHHDTSPGMTIEGDISASGTHFADTGSFNSLVAPGSIIGYTSMFPGTAGRYDTTTSFVVIQDNYDSGDGAADHYLQVTFEVPPSNKVEIEVYLPYCSAIDGDLYLGLATATDATTLNAKYEHKVWDVDETDLVKVTQKWVIDGSDHSWTAGQSKTLYAMVKEGTAGGRLFWGDAIINYGYMIMKATSLPAIIGKGT